MVLFDRVVFEPRGELASLYEKYSLPPKWHGNDSSIEAQGAAEARELLAAVLSEWIDFLLVPKPARFMIYADHDEYVTFLARRKARLSGVVNALTAAGFRSVEYVRTL